MAAHKRTIGNSASEDVKRLSAELTDLRARLQECEDTLAAIRAGGVDAIVVDGHSHEQVFTLAGTENAYRVFVEAMDEGAITVDAVGTILFANKAFAKLLARPLESIVGTSIFEIASSSEKSLLEAVFREALNNIGGRCELALNRDLEHLPVLVSARSCVEFGTRAICMVVTDLSEQKRHEQIVADGKLARLILSHADEAMAVCDSLGRVLHCNRSLEDLCATNPLLRHFDEIVPLEMVDTKAPQRDEPLHFRVRDALAGQEFRGAEVCLRPGVREPIHLLLSTSPLLLPNLEKAGLLISLFNIEERRRTEHALRRSEKLAATGRLAASIAHEINNPLAALTNLIYLIETEADSPTLIGYARTAQQELARVAHITRQTLGFYRESAALADINLAELIESALFLYAAAVRQKNLKVECDIGFKGKIHGHANELRQVFSNLLGNAIEALPADGRLRIHVYQSREWTNSRKPGVRIVVADTGPGIRAEHKRALFQPFFTTKAEKGTGLGLWVSQGIIEKHGGFIRLRSSTRPGQSGTVFCIFLPCDNVGSRQAVA